MRPNVSCGAPARACARGGHRRGGHHRGGLRIAAAGAALAATVAGGLPAAAASQDVAVIVTSSGPLTSVAAVRQVGGTVRDQFGLINGAEALVPALAEPALAALPGITVTPDSQVTVQSTTGRSTTGRSTTGRSTTGRSTTGRSSRGRPAAESTASHAPSDAFLAETGATRLAARGDTGQGVTVAVLDTGIDNLPDFAGRLAGGVDLTGGNNPYQDDYGHGTFVAGLIAGDGASSAGQYQGEAPGAKLVSIKVAGADGTTHLGTLIAGLQWAVDHTGSDGIKVLNLSLGFKPTMSTVLNPVDQAVEAAWRAGLTVVASAGNAGPFNGTILSPGDDPLVITVGALDDLATASPGDDAMNDFSSTGPTSPDGWVKPDLVTSGRSVVSLAAPGSAIYAGNPASRVGAANFAATGTSFSAAITSGAAALVLAAHPGLTPDQVKGRLLGTTRAGPLGNPLVDGHGALDAYAAATSGPVDFGESAAGLRPARPGGTVPLAPARPVDTWNVHLWSGISWPQVPGSRAPWNGLDWTGADWNGMAANGASWNASAWSGVLWNGASWSGSAWDGTPWSGSAWNGAAWGPYWETKSWNGG
jgi:serine protease AprX